MTARAAPPTPAPTQRPLFAAPPREPGADLGAALTNAIRRVRALVADARPAGTGPDAVVRNARALAAAAVLRYRRGLHPLSDLVVPQPPVGPGPALPARAGRAAEAVAELASEFPTLEAHYLLGVTYLCGLPPSLRTKLGAFYTPPALVRRLHAMADDARADAGPPRVLDLACGSGLLLVPVVERLVRALEGAAPDRVLDEVAARARGVEVDPFAGWMAQTLLETLVLEACRAAGRNLAPVVTVADSLHLDAEEGGYDLVVGNPPYGRIGLPPELRERFGRSLHGHANLYGVFADLALRWSAPGAAIALVTPTGFLGGHYFKALRALMRREAPPVEVDFVRARKGVFEDVLQETCLSVYRVGGAEGPVRVRFHGADGVLAEGAIRLPEDSEAPWILPRAPQQVALVTRLAGMPHRLRDLGYAVSTGPLVWNRHKGQLRATRVEGVLPLVWAEAVTDGAFAFRALRRGHLPFFAAGPRDGWLVQREACALVQRTTAKEQRRRLVAAELPAAFLAEHGGAVVENHLNMVRPTAPATVRPRTVARLLNSRAADQAFRCISGSVAVSAAELAAMPVPSPAVMRELEAMLDAAAADARVEAFLDQTYSLEP